MTFRHMRVWDYIDAVSRTGSIRKGAERLNVTPSAVQRRIEDIEHDLGAQIFERSKQGMQLTAAGELFIHWVRSQAADLERVQSQIEDLSGLRRGHVRIACSQAAVHSFLPRIIGAFCARYPLISFAVEVCDHETAVRALIDYQADLALAFNPLRHAELQPLSILPQKLLALMRPGHPLAAKTSLRLRDCVAYPVAIADRTFSSRQIISGLLAASSTRLDIRLESNSFEMLCNFVRHNDAIAFHIEIGAIQDTIRDPLVARPIDDRDLAHGTLVLAQLKSRTLPVAPAKFAEFLASELDRLREARAA